jgi:hypothetical protein
VARPDYKLSTALAAGGGNDSVLDQASFGEMHGTACLSVLAGKPESSTNGIKGVAPNAEIYAKTAAIPSSFTASSNSSVSSGPASKFMTASSIINNHPKTQTFLSRQPTMEGEEGTSGGAFAAVPMEEKNVVPGNMRRGRKLAKNGENGAYANPVINPNGVLKEIVGSEGSVVFRKHPSSISKEPDRSGGYR